MKLTNDERIKQNKLYLEKKDYNALYEINYAFIMHLSKKFYNVAPQEELISLINLGFVKAIQTFNQAKEANFISYFSLLATNEILMERRKRMRPIHLYTVSYEATVSEGLGEGETLALLETLVDDEQVEDIILKNEQITQLLASLNKLSKKQEFVIRSYFFEHKTHKEIGLLIGSDRTYVCRIQAKALAKLRKNMQESRQ